MTQQAGLNPEQKNVTLVSAAKEYIATLPAGTKKFMIKARDETGQDTTDDIRYSWIAGHVAARVSTFGIIPNGAVLWEDHIDINPEKKLYFAASTPGVVVQIDFWM